MTEAEFLTRAALVFGGFIAVSGLGFWLVALLDDRSAERARRDHAHPAE